MDHPTHSADLAAARLLGAVRDPGLLPAPLPGTGLERITGCAPATGGLTVHLWGATSGVYLTGQVLACVTRMRQPHPTLGPRSFHLQLLLRFPPGLAPGSGDSGGPLLTDEGQLVGLLASGPRPTLGVPAREGLAALGLTILLTPTPLSTTRT